MRLVSYKLILWCQCIGTPTSSKISSVSHPMVTWPIISKQGTANKAGMIRLTSRHFRNLAFRPLMPCLVLAQQFTFGS
jgi:hypothetical protein